MTERDPPPSRTAALVLTTAGGDVLGALSALPVATPWWQDVGPVVDAFRERYGVEVTILRLLEAERAAPPGGEVTYLGQVDRAVPVEPWVGRIDEHPLRLAYARPGGPAADLAWAKMQLAEIGLELAGSPAQVRTWNLSSIWRLPCASGVAWLKVVPPFFAHEGAIIAHLAAWPVPRLLARDGGRMLLAQSPGEDLYGAGRQAQLRMIDVLVELQTNLLGRTDPLTALDLPDWRGPALIPRLAKLAGRRANDLDRRQQRRLAAFIETLPQRWVALDDCGPGDTLVHGDFHPGNFRGRNGSLTLHDWGDCGLGHPLLDQSAFLSAIPDEDRALARTHWWEAWSAAAPGMDYARAERVVEPLAAARRALVYQDFLDAIEPSEHPYHAADPVFWLGRALDLADAHDL
jgi:hypothetical protein